MIVEDLVQARATSQGGQGSQAVVAPAPPVPPAANAEQFHALHARRAELERQLETVTDRRDDLANQLEEAPQMSRPGLLERIQLLDARGTQLEQQLLQTDDAIAAGVAQGLGPSQMITIEEIPQPPRISDTAIQVMVGEAVFFILLCFLLYRLGLARGKAAVAGAGSASSGRMDSLQHAVDAIAVEVERISENQRYVTKMLNEGQAPAAPIASREEEGARRRG